MASNGYKRPKFESHNSNSRRFSSDYDHEEPNRRKRPEAEPNKVLLFTIINPSYPITTEVLHTICSPIGSVARIVVFKKRGVQAMIEFEDLEKAQKAKDELNGADIYSGCCTLKIEYAKPTRLNVYKNDNDSWDYTNSDQGGDESGPKKVLLPDPRPPTANHNMGGPMTMSSQNQIPFRGGYPDDDYFGAAPPFAKNYRSPVPDKYMQNMPLPRAVDRLGPPVNNNMLGTPPGAPPPNYPGSVLMVYELDAERSNPDKVFNLFCLYGNVSKIKFLKTKAGCCMVQMSDYLAAERAMENLAKTPLKNGKKLAVAISKQPYLSEVSFPYELPDKSLSYKDYGRSKNNRFSNSKMALKNRIQAPCELIHFFNAPPEITVEQLEEIFTKAGVNRPVNINIFSPKLSLTDSDEKPFSSSGLIEFENSQEATDAIMQCNHQNIDNPSGTYPFVLKLCFSSARSVNGANNSSRRGHHNNSESWD